MTLKQYVLPNILPLILGASFAIAATPVDAKQSRHQKHHHAAKSAQPAKGVTVPSAKEQRSCKAEILVDIQTGEVLASKNPDNDIRPASTIKLLAIMATEDAINQGEIDPNTDIPAPLYKNSHGIFSPHAYVCDQTKEYLVKHKITTASVMDRIKEAAIASFNTVARVLGDITLKQVQNLLTKFGLSRTHVAETAGTSNASNCRKENKGEENISTVRDLAKIAGNIPNYPRLFAALQEKNVTIDGVIHKNTNALIEDNIFGKTGTVNAGKTFAGVAFTKDGRTLAVAVAECPHNGGHFKAVKALLAAHVTPTNHGELAKAYNLKPSL